MPCCSGPLPRKCLAEVARRGQVGGLEEGCVCRKYVFMLFILE